MVLLSERSNVGGAPTYRNYFPRLRKYPPLGFFLACGAHVRQGYLPQLMYPIDLVPTILYLTGNPVLNDLDGRILFSVLDEDFYFKHELRFR